VIARALFGLPELSKHELNEGEFMPIKASRQTTILCIDDDTEALGLRTAVLEENGYRVLGATNGDQATKHFVAEEIDLILSALLLPGIPGAELSMFMRQVRPEVSVVLLSRSDSPPAALLHQTDGWVEHRAEAKTLLDCVEDVLARRAA
jgi:DNA-binding NtrC family response regulator